MRHAPEHTVVVALRLSHLGDCLPPPTAAHRHPSQMMLVSSFATAALALVPFEMVTRPVFGPLLQRHGALRMQALMGAPGDAECYLFDTPGGCAA